MLALAGGSAGCAGGDVWSRNSPRETWLDAWQYSLIS
jgi:hypothetical protein